MGARNDSSRRIRISLSITEKTHQLLKETALKRGTNMSQLVADWVWKECTPRIYGERVFRFPPDTMYRLEQYAYQSHQSIEQAVISLIWKAKVKESVLKGQLSFFEEEV